MTAIALKKRIYQAVNAIDDTSLLEAVYTILNRSVLSKAELLTPMSLEDFYARNAQSKKEIKAGTLFNHKAIK